VVPARQMFPCNRPKPLSLRTDGRRENHSEASACQLRLRDYDCTGGRSSWQWKPCAIVLADGIQFETDARTRLHRQGAQLPQLPRAVQERMVRRASVQTLQEPQQLARGYDFGAGVRSRKSPLERTLAGILPSISRRCAIARVRMVRIRSAFVRNTSPPRHETGNDIRSRVA